MTKSGGEVSCFPTMLMSSLLFMTTSNDSHVSRYWPHKEYCLSVTLKKKTVPTSLWHGETRRRPPDLFNAKCKAKNFPKVYRFKNTWSGFPPCSLTLLCRRQGRNSVVFCRGCPKLTQQVSMLCTLRLQTVKQPQSSASHRMFPQVFMRENDGGSMGITLLAAAALGLSPSFTAACLLSWVKKVKNVRTPPLPSTPLTNLKTSWAFPLTSLCESNTH